MKKVLIAATALPMVLTPRILSFATTNNAPVTGSDQLNYESNLNIEGIVLSESNTAPEGQISVTLPTTATFAVNADGTVITPTDLSIINKSSCDIDVTISNFKDSTPTLGKGITVVDRLEDSHDRSYVSLTLLSQSGITGQQVVLKSENFTSQKLGTIVAGATTNLTLIGQAGDADKDLDATKKGLNDSFTLTFTIAKTSTTI